jgi:hypothetical protein
MSPLLVIHRLLLLAMALAIQPVTAQIPNTLLSSFQRPERGGIQEGAQLGLSVAVDGGLTVVGAPLDDLGRQDSGVVKVFDSATGALLHVIPNPRPAMGDQFGNAVAISGTRIVVGIPFDDTGAHNEANAGSACVFDLAGATPTAPVATFNNPAPAQNDSFGGTVAISGTRVVVGAYFDDTGAFDAGSAYVYDLASAMPAVPVVTLNNPSPAENELFGRAVAVFSTRVVVGANFDDSGPSVTGTAYVYDLAGVTPAVPVATLKDPDPAAADYDYFGTAVAISGTRVVVGTASIVNGTGPGDAGRAYVYDLAGTTPTVPIATLLNPSPADNEYFGTAVAISGARVVVGAYMDDTGATDAGSAYIYNLADPSPTVPVATLNNPGPAANDQFGRALSISGTRVVIGAYLDDTGATDAGSAYLYDIASTTPAVPTATLNNPGPALNDNFGRHLAISGTRVVIGANANDTGAVNAGSAYVYDLAGATRNVPVVTLDNPDPDTDDYFGNAMAISGTRVVIGASWDDTGASDAGSAYVFDLAGANPTVPVATLNNPAPAEGDYFGSSVAISGTRVVVAAYYDNAGGTDAGIAYVYDLANPTPAVPVATLNNPGAAYDYFGFAVAMSETRLVVGAFGNDTGAGDAGCAYVYDLAGATPAVPVATLNNPNPGDYGNYFGWSVAMSGTRVVVGAIYDDTAALNAGSAYVYDLSSTTPTVPVVNLTKPQAVPVDNFGWSVAISGRRIVVGAFGDDTGANGAGSAYVYDLASATPPAPVATLHNPGPAASDWFGYATAIEGVNVVIGVPYNDAIMPADKSYAYIFGPHPLDQDSDGLRDAWELSYWPAINGHGPADDFDHDGVPELLELAFGLNPTLSDASGMPAAILEDGCLTMTLTKQPGVAYRVQSAGTLLSGQPGSFSAASTNIVINTDNTLQVRDNVPTSSAARRFLRVEVTAAP